MSEKYSEHLDKEHPECPNCDSALGFNGNEFDEGQPDRCFICTPAARRRAVINHIRLLKDRAIETLISLRMALAKQEGIEDWQNDSGDGEIEIIEAPIMSGDIQEIIWGLDQ